MLKLQNEFIFAPIKTGYGDQSGLVNNRHLEFYKRHSKHVAAVIPEPFYLDKGIRELPVQMGIDADEKNEGLQKLTDVIHQNGAKAIAHLSHPGRMANPKLPNNYHISSTDKACEVMGATPRSMNSDDFIKVVDLFVDASIRAEKTGFDIIELQFGHGYLLAQFLSPKVNNRTDEYGGSFENRMKFPLQVMEAVTNSVSIPIIARISADEMIPDGIKLEESIKFVKELKKLGVELVHVSAGTVCNTAPWYYQHMFVPKGKTWDFAKKIQEETGVLSMFLGQINTFEDIDNLKENFGAKYIALGRALIADEDFVGKYQGVVKENFRPCLACAEGCLGGVKGGKGLQCLVNPKVGTNIIEGEKITERKRVAIVGAGLAGLEAAVELKKRGYMITVFEKNQIGGQFNLAYLPPHKQSLKKLIDFYLDEIDYYNIQVVYKEAVISDLLSYDEIILASGSYPVIPTIKGLQKYSWADILKKQNTPCNKRIAVIGGGLIGTEVANHLLVNDNKVFVFEMLDSVANGMEMIEQKLTLKAFQNDNIKIYTSSIVEEINGDKIIFKENEQRQEIDGIDMIVVATGMKEDVPFDSREFNKEIHIVGDASKVGKAQTAIFDAYSLSQRI
jgi:2,4-dienoyl-CoA reductase-like NADH-dependent reductase (Old Yellow Enzyme family)/thioredoxin reductase